MDLDLRQEHDVPGARCSRTPKSRRVQGRGRWFDETAKVAQGDLHVEAVISQRTCVQEYNLILYDTL